MAVLELIAEHGPVRAQLRLTGVPDRYLIHQGRKQVLEEVGLDAVSVAARFLSAQAAPV